MARSLKKSAKLSLRKVRINSPSIRYKPDSSSIERDQRIEFLGENGNDDHDDDDHHDGDDDNAEEFNNNNNGSSESEEFEDKEETFKVAEDEEQHKDDAKRGGEKDRIGSEHKLGLEVVDHGGEEKVKKMVAVVAATAEEEKEEKEEAGNRVMVVVDKALASTGALEWAITHTLQPQDTLFLLYFSKPYNKGKSKNRKREVKTDELVHTLKKLCQTKRPGIEVEIRRLEGKDKDKEKEKGEKIVEEAKKQEASLLVVGQEKKPPVWRLIKRWAWKRRRGHGGVLKYCLENASCMTIAVKPKNRNLGGYLITTKRHKNFWLLA